MEWEARQYHCAVGSTSNHACLEEVTVHGLIKDRRTQNISEALERARDRNLDLPHDSTSNVSSKGRCVTDVKPVLADSLENVLCSIQLLHALDLRKIEHTSMSKDERRSTNMRQIPNRPA